MSSPNIPKKGWWHFCRKCDLPTYNIPKICNTCIYNRKKKYLYTNK